MFVILANIGFTRRVLFIFLNSEESFLIYGLELVSVRVQASVKIKVRGSFKDFDFTVVEEIEFFRLLQNCRKEVVETTAVAVTRVKHCEN